MVYEENVVRERHVQYPSVFKWYLEPVLIIR